MRDAIVVDELRKRYGLVEAVAGVSFRVGEGEIFGLLGPNGAGKSTTVRVLATLTRPDAGRALVAGHDVVRETSAVRAAIGYVAQSSHADAYLTGRENLVIQARAHGLSRRDSDERAEELLALIELTEARHRLVETYSGGMRRRLDIAMGIVHRPRVLFLDEPTTGLDPEARSAIWSELARLARTQTLTILLTTHYLEEADRLAARISIISNGRVVAEGAPDDLKQRLGGDTVTVRISAADSSVVDAVLALPDVHEARLEANLLRAWVGHSASALPAILAILDRRGIDVEAAAMSRPTLDDVYLHLTGRSFEREHASA
jgi:ABC-2 type transport system ATP-binding protein